MAKSWYVHWDNLMIFLGYPEEIRKIIYTLEKFTHLFWNTPVNCFYPVDPILFLINQNCYIV